MMVENIGFLDYIVDDKFLDEEYKDVIKINYQIIIVQRVIIYWEVFILSYYLIRIFL